MKRPLKYTLAIIAAIAALFIAAALLIQFINLDPFRKRIETMAGSVVGRQVQIEGHLDVNLFPYPEVILNNVSLANADWGSEPVMARIGHLDAAISPLSLFSDTLIVKRVRLNDVNVLLEIREGQPGNWVMGATTPPESSEKETAPHSRDLQLPLFADMVEFNNISVTLRSPGRSDAACRIATFTLHPDPSGDLVLKSSGEALGLPMALRSSIRSRESVINMRAVSADIEASLSDVRLTGRLSTSDLGTLADLNGALRVDVQDIRKLLQVAKIEAPLEGPLGADTTFEKNGAVWTTGATAEVSGLTATLDGAYEDKRLDIDLTLAPLKRAAELFGLPELKPDALHLNARVAESTAGGYDIEQLKVDTGESTLSARGQIHGDGSAQSDLVLESPDLSTLSGTLPATPLRAEASVEYAADKTAVSNFSVTLDKLDTRMTGRLSASDLGTLAGLHGAMRVDVKDIRKPLQMAKIEAPLEGPFGADTTFEKNGAVWKTDATAEVSGLTATLDGAYEDKRLDLGLTLAPLKRAGELFGLPELEPEALHLNARVAESAANGGYDIEQLKVDIGESTLSARGQILGDGSVQSDLVLESPDLSALSGTWPAIPVQAEASVEYAVDKTAVSNFSVTLDKFDTRLTGRLSASDLATLAGLHGALRVDVEDIRKLLQIAKIEAPLEGPLGADTTFEKNGAVWKTDATAEVSGLTATIDGAYEDKRLDFDLTLVPLKRAAELFGLPELKPDALHLNARVTESAAGGYDIEQLKVDTGESTLSARGQILGDGSVQSDLVLGSPDLSALSGKWPAIPVQAEASVEYAADKTAVSNFSVTMDKSDLKGKIALDRSGKNNITVDLSSEMLDLRPFSRPDSSAEPVKATEPKEAYVFKEKPLPLSLLDKMEVGLKLSASRIYYGRLELKNAAVDTAVHDGHMEAKVKFDPRVSGHAAARLDLQTKGNQAVVDTLVSLSDFRMGITSGGEIGPDEVPPASLTLELNTTGASPRQMASAANGRILLTAGPGKTSNSMMRMFTNDIVNQLLTALNPFAKTDKFTSWDCAAVSVEIADGTAELSTLMVQGEKLMVVGGGDIDLGTEKLNIEFQTKPRSGVGVSANMFVSPFVKVIGTLAHPSIGLNKKGTLLTGGAAVATGGLSFLIKSLYDRLSVEGDHCEEIMESVGEHTPYSF